MKGGATCLFDLHVRLGLLWIQQLEKWFATQLNATSRFRTLPLAASAHHANATITCKQICQGDDKREALLPIPMAIAIHARHTRKLTHGIAIQNQLDSYLPGTMSIHVSKQVSVVHVGITNRLPNTHESEEGQNIQSGLESR